MDNMTTLIASLIAAAVSLISVLINIFLTIRKNRSEYVTKNRMQWIKEVRSLLGKFLDLYIDGKEKNKLLKVKNKICLYLRDGVISYDNLIQQIDLCIANGYNDLDCHKLVKCSQVVLNEVWVRIKRETGVGKTVDKGFDKMFGYNYKK